MEKPYSTFKRYIKIALIFILPLLHSCSRNNKTGNLPSWILGEWKCKGSDFHLTESWKFDENKNKFIGTTTWIINNTKSIEHFELFEHEEALYFSVIVNDTNLLFKSIKYKNDTLCFVNLRNEFPKYIYYLKTEDKKMVCWLENFKSDPEKQIYNLTKK